MNGRWRRRRERRTERDRLAAEQRLAAELRTQRLARDARLSAEELARQVIKNPRGVEPVERQGQEGT